MGGKVWFGLAPAFVVDLRCTNIRDNLKGSTRQWFHFVRVNGWSNNPFVPTMLGTVFIFVGILERSNDVKKGCFSFETVVKNADKAKKKIHDNKS